MIGRILVEQGAVSSRKLEEALAEQRRRAARGTQVRLGELLVEMRAVTPTQLSKALAERGKISAR